MYSSVSSTSGAQVVGAGSLLNTLIPTAVVQPSAQAVVLPYVGNLAGGQYTSEIVAVVDAVQNGAVVGIDCTHKLTDSSGNTLLVKFRYFAPSDIEALAKVLAEYGLKGGIGAALMGLQETVDIAPRPGSNRYLCIAHRVLLSNTASVTAPTQGTSVANTSCHKKGGVLSRHSRNPMSKSLSHTKSLLDADDDSEFDDFLDEDDEPDED